MLSHCSLLRIAWPKPTGVLEHCRELNFGSPFLGAFASDRIPKATKDVNVHFFIHNFTYRDEIIIVSANSCKLYERIPELF